MSIPSSYRLLRALGWLRWRMIFNTLTRSGARDMLERLSRAAQSLLPLAIVIMLLPIAVVLLVLGGWTGWTLAEDAAFDAWPLQIVRWGLMVMFLITALSPVILSTGQQAAGMIRLLLLPIPGRVLYAAHAAGALADPWVFLSIPALAGVSAGLAFNGRAVAALILALAGIGVLATLLGLASLASAVLQLAVRDRRRAELLGLAGMLLIVIISLVPSIIFADTEPRANATRERQPEVQLAAWIRAPGAFLPSELYISGARQAADGSFPAALAIVVGIGAWAVAFHGLTWPVYQRLLQTPASSGGLRKAESRPARIVRLPFAKPEVSAVAVAFVCLAYRSPRGRSVVLMPVVLLAGLAAMSLAREASIPFGPVTIGGGYSLGLFGVVMTLMSIGPLVFNQFAVDGAGLTLQFLAPLSTRALLHGKAIGGALIAAGPCLLAVAAGVATGGYSPGVWALIVLGACASYLLTAPVAAVLSLLFPRAVDLSSIGQGSNAHQAAGLLGFLSFAASCAPPAGLAYAAISVLNSTTAALGLLVAWLAVTIVLAWIGFRIAERLVDERRENLAMIAQGR